MELINLIDWSDMLSFIPTQPHRLPSANNESSEVFDIIKPGRRVKIKGYRR